MKNLESRSRDYYTSVWRQLMNRQIEKKSIDAALDGENIKNPALLRDIPYDKIYEAARKEASRKKPVFFIHKYFARRITSNFRMMLIGSLLPYNEDIWEHFYENYENTVNDNVTVLDPFMGGGTTIFESLRLNTNVIGSDLQPLSNFVTRALVSKINIKSVNDAVHRVESNVADKIKNYQRTTCPECGKEADIMYTFHVKKIHGMGKCREHKLFSSFVIALKKDNFTLICPKCGEVFDHNFKKDGAAHCACGYIIESPKKGFVNHGKFKCEDCGEEFTLNELSPDTGYPFETELIAIEYYCPHCQKHGYKRIDEDDKTLFNKACQKYDEIKDELPIPDQVIPVGYNTNQMLNHGYKQFSDLFNKRQLLCLGMLLKEINKIDNQSNRFWLLLAFSGMLEMNNMFCRYQANAYKICNIFFNHAYVPISMPVENNVWGTKLGTGTFIKTINKIIRGKRFCNNIYDIATTEKNGKIEVEKIASNETVEASPVDVYSDLAKNSPLLLCQDSSNLKQIPDNSVDLVLTDPPFGANVMYSELIDFFHVWLYKSTLADALGFVSPLSPKDKEIVVNSVQNKTQDDYEAGLTRVFSECRRTMKSEALMIFSFHDRSVESWFSILKSICKAGFDVIRSYPLHSETRTGAHTSNKNSIALDIMLICRKKDTGESLNVDDEMRKIIEKDTYNALDSIMQRLTAVNAEITIPDIENIFISEYVHACYLHGIKLDSLLNTEELNLRTCIDGLSDYCSKYNISERRTGWWSELFNEKWNV